MDTLGDRIRIAREGMGLQQQQLAEMIGVKSGGVISNWETGKNKPDADKIVKLCESLNVSSSYLLNYYKKTQSDFQADQIKEMFSRLSPENKNMFLAMLKSAVEAQNNKPAHQE